MDESIWTAEKDWQNRKENFLANQDRLNSNIDKLKKNFLSGKASAVQQVLKLILMNSNYPFKIEKEVFLEYNPINKMVVVDYFLPNLDDIPNIEGITYISANSKIRVKCISKNQLHKLYDDIVYKIILRSIHELFVVDTLDKLKSVSFNGWVKRPNSATGNDEINCIASIHVTKGEFVKINLSKVDPKACFKNLKGIGSSKLSGMVAIQPIIQLSSNSKFVNPQQVVYDESTNLASMDWEDFEHLIRELFEKEFSENGGEVKVTRASRDGGVDAIAFDPDPIRGGKIVIQAKRYTNTVGVSAVRDLYGTVMNEGANKGILVTTSDYGPDSYSFAKGKPLTLLNGANLLYLLEKHGNKSRIDIKEAKRIMMENNKIS